MRHIPSNIYALQQQEYTLTFEIYVKHQSILLGDVLASVTKPTRSQQGAT